MIDFFQKKLIEDKNKFVIKNSTKSIMYQIHKKLNYSSNYINKIKLFQKNIKIVVN